MRRDQTLGLVEQLYVPPVYHSQLSVDLTAVVGDEPDEISEIVEEIEFSD